MHILCDNHTSNATIIEVRNAAKGKYYRGHNLAMRVSLDSVRDEIKTVWLESSWAFPESCIARESRSQCSTIELSFSAKLMHFGQYTTAIMAASSEFFVGHSQVVKH